MWGMPQFPSHHGVGSFSTENLMAGPTASTRNDPRLSLRLTDASPLGNVSA